MGVRFAQYTLLLSIIKHSSAGNLDPLKGCVDPKSRDELQAAIDVLQAGVPSTSTRILKLCKDTTVNFGEYDDRIYIDVNSKEFVMKCDVEETCLIDGGSIGRHENGSREFYGNGGFLSINANVKIRSTLHIEGIGFRNFDTQNFGGVIDVYVSGIFHLYLHKCTFFKNYAKYSGGAIHFSDNNDFNTEIYLKDCTFKSNTAELNGGAIAFRSKKGLMNIRMKDTDFYDNHAKQHGGGFIIGGQVTRKYRSFHLQDCEFKNNKGAVNGGGFVSVCYEASGAACIGVIKGGEFKKNIAGAYGEAFMTENHKMYFDDVDFNKDEFRMVPAAAGASAGNLVYVIDR